VRKRERFGKTQETADGHPFTVFSDSVRGIDTADNRNIVRTIPIPQSPLTGPLLAWMSEEGKGWGSSVLLGRAYGAQRLSHASSEADPADIGEVWNRFLIGMRAEIAESTARRNASFLLDFMDWLLDRDLIVPAERRTVEARAKHEFTGYTERHRRRRESKLHFSLDTLRGLYSAIRMEMEAVVAVLDGDTDRNLHDLSGIALFPLLMAIDQGLRSAELNRLCWQDIYARPEHLFVHGRNKASAYLPMPPYARRSWEVAKCWMERYRPATEVAGDAPALEYMGRSGKVVRLRATQIRWTFLNKYFYQKYFNLKDDNGIPILAQPNQQTGELEPFSVGFGNLRHLAITGIAIHESDPEVVRRFARHKDIRTTRINYLTLTQDRRRWTVAAHLGPLAEKVRMTIEGRIALDEELGRAEDVGALLPVGGACAEALAGKFDCQRAIDCRVCPHFLIDIRMRWYFIESAEKHEREAARARNGEGFKRDPQNLLALAAIDRAIVKIIDERKAGLI
jgi:integrase